MEMNGCSHRLELASSRTGRYSLFHKFGVPVGLVNVGIYTLLTHQSCTRSRLLTPPGSTSTVPEDTW
jgi:hypothetical protein